MTREWKMRLLKKNGGIVGFGRKSLSQKEKKPLRPKKSVLSEIAAALSSKCGTAVSFVEEGEGEPSARTVPAQVRRRKFSARHEKRLICPHNRDENPLRIAT